MIAREMLENVYEDSSDFHDGLNGWFGFDVSDGETLTVSFTPWDDHAEETGTPIVRRWHLTRIWEDA